MSYTTYFPDRATTLIVVALSSAPAGIVIEKSASGIDKVPPSGPTTADTPWSRLL
jgi:hypothetical protein